MIVNKTHVGARVVLPLFGTAVTVLNADPQNTKLVVPTALVWYDTHFDCLKFQVHGRF